MNPTPPNLRALFGDRFLIGHDPAVASCAEKSDPWLMQMPCRGHGVTIYPHGKGLLAVQCDHRRFIAKQLAKLGLALHQDGDHEKTFVFPVAMFNEVARIVKPLRRPALTDQQRADRASRMKAINVGKIGPFGAKFASGGAKVALNATEADSARI